MNKLSAPPPGEVTWIFGIDEGPSCRIAMVKAQTWYVAREKACAALSCSRGALLWRGK